MINDGRELQMARSALDKESAPIPPAPGLAYSNDSSNEDAIDIRQWVVILLSHKWLIIITSTLFLCLGFVYAWLAEPIYQADGLLQVEEQAAGLSALKVLDELSGALTSSVSAELEILRSRMILGQVVDAQQLDLIAQPVYFPIIGKAIFRRYRDTGVAYPWFGLDDYAWGGEEISVERLEVPNALLGESLILIAGRTGRFVLTDEMQHWQVEGQIGELVEKEYAADERIVLVISRLKARPGTRFRVLRESRNTAINTLADQFSVTEKGRNTGIVHLRLTGAERLVLSDILDKIMGVYVQQNIARRSAEAENTLRFLEKQLPALKEQLDSAEDAYNGYRLERGSIDLDIETQSLLSSIVKLDSDFIALQQEREGLRQNFKPEHPRLLALDGKIARLERESEELQVKINRLPSTQQKLLRLKRDVDVSNQLYVNLRSTAMQLHVARASAVGNARIIDDAALARDAVAPRKSRILAVSFVLGGLFSLMLIWLLRSLRFGIEDSESIERHFGIPVYATVPHSKREEKLAREIKGGKAKHGLLALIDAEDDAVESMRGLRVALRFATADAVKPGLLLTGPALGVGKSFVSKNLAILLAQSGESVLLIDADMRRGYLHRDFGVKREPGLSDYLAHNLSIEDILISVAIDNLSLIACGTRPPNSSELLMHPRFDYLLETLKPRFRHIVVDAPPILAVSDAAVIGRWVGSTLMILRAGRHPLQEIEQAVRRLTLSGVHVKGFVLNDLDTTRMRYRYGYSGYHYQYKYK